MNHEVINRVILHAVSLTCQACGENWEIVVKNISNFKYVTYLKDCRNNSLVVSFSKVEGFI